MKAAAEWIIARLAELLGVLFGFLIDIWDAFVGLTAELWRQALFFIEGVIYFLWDEFRSAFELIWNKVRDAVQTWWDHAVKVVEPWYEAIYTAIAERLQEIGDEFVQYLKDNDYWPRIEEMKNVAGLVADAYADAAWLLPLNEGLAIFASTIVVIGVIRLLRWVLSFLWITG
jgi:hypothetical protein